MEWVWWTVDGLKPVCWSVLGILMGYVLLLTILYAVLGRYREQ
jgi:predicted permease